MDMETDIPAPDELMWLESNSLYLEEAVAGDDDGYFSEQDLDADLSHSVGKCPPKSSDYPASSSNEDQSSRKRLRPEENKKVLETFRSAEHTEEGRSGAKRRVTSEVSDDDWLHYSPRREAETEVGVEMQDVPEKCISRFASEIEGECMPVTGPHGQRVYAKLCSRDIAQRNLLSQKTYTGLLSEPISMLNQRVEQEALAKALRESFGERNDNTSPITPLTNEQLWVEKYAPSSFTELLSDEGTNREVLLWLKQWDSYVFGSHIRATGDDVLSALRMHSSAIQNQKFSNKRNFFAESTGHSFKNQNQNSSNASDKANEIFKGLHSSWSKRSLVDKPPEQKVLLLCGPPGLGKTTLAHVAAKHCGYHVVEINASDDRTASAIETKILDVVQMNSVMADSKPKCLVIDEIDGALADGKGAVEVILKMVAAEKKSNSEKGGDSTQEGQAHKSSSKRGHKPAKLSRPIICICNDLYAPALRQLRQVAKVHSFVQPTVSRVVNRLKYICKKEGFKTNSIALSALAESTECDIRSCLNTLQFLNKKREALNVLDVDSQVIGRKDMSKSAIDVWKEVFHKKKIKHGGKSVNGCNGDGDMEYMHSLLSNRGEYELTMDGIHENFLRLSYHDPMLQKTVKCLDILGTSDSFLHYVSRTKQMSIHAYQPPLAIRMSRLISQVDKPNIEWPKSLQRNRVMLMEKKDMLKTWQQRMRPFISRHLSVESFVHDVTSLFIHILSPPNLRPVALDLLSEREKDELHQLVDTMVSYAITYKHSKPEPLERMHTTTNNNIFGASLDDASLSLDPPIGDFVHFKDYQPEHFVLPFTVKQILVHEVGKKRIIQDSAGKSLRSTHDGNNETEVSKYTMNKAVPATDMPAPYSVESNGKGKLQSNEKQMTAQSLASETNSDKPAPKKSCYHSSNFFDRFRKESGSDTKTRRDGLQKEATTERDSRPLLFKYNEGFTNAVKRPVKIRDLLF